VTPILPAPYHNSPASPGVKVGKTNIGWLGWQVQGARDYRGGRGGGDGIIGKVLAAAAAAAVVVVVVVVIVIRHLLGHNSHLYMSFEVHLFPHETMLIDITFGPPKLLDTPSFPVVLIEDMISWGTRGMAYHDSEQG